MPTGSLVDSRCRLLPLAAFGVTLMLAVSGCHDTTAPTTGAVRVITATTGADLDPDGYRLRIDDASTSTPIGSNGDVTLKKVALGYHLLYLDGAIDNCQVPANPRSITVTAGSIEPITFGITCVQRTGSVLVSVLTSGENIDYDGYLLRVDNEAGVAIDANGSMALPSLQPGAHTIWLESVASNCTIAGGNPHPVSVVADRQVAVHMSVTCTRRTGSVRIVTSTVGVELDPDGYLVYLDELTPLRIATNGTLTWPDIAEGQHSVSVGDVAMNCRVTSLSSQSVQVVFGETASLEFRIDCRAAGALQVAVTTTGTPRDPNGYSVQVLSTAEQSGWSEPVTGNGSVEFAGIPAGPYQVSLTNVSLNCDVAPTSVAVTVVGGATTPIPFAVTCGPLGRFAYVLTAGPTESDIYSANSDASIVLRLTSETGRQEEPAWSRDGLKIAYTSIVGTASDIFVMNADGSDKRRLTTNAFAHSPSWSPNGTAIAFVSNIAGNQDIFVMGSDGSNRLSLTSDLHSDVDPAWSPDGRRIAFASDRDGDFEIYVVNADGSGLVKLTNDQDPETQPAWSPDGTQLAFSRGVCDQYYGCSTYYLEVMNGDGSSRHSIVGGLSLPTYPTWSPSGQRIAFANSYCYYDCYYYDVMTVRLDGSDPMPLGLSEARQPDWRP
jgi:hypothetical protein